MRVAAVEGFGLGSTAACFSFPQVRRRESAAFAFSAWVGPKEEDWRAPMGMRVEQAWDSCRRCFRQYCLLHVSQPTPTEFRVLM